jgi:hypothetical protein
VRFSVVGSDRRPMLVAEPDADAACQLP